MGRARRSRSAAGSVSVAPYASPASSPHTLSDMAATPTCWPSAPPACWRWRASSKAMPTTSPRRCSVASSQPPTGVPCGSRWRSTRLSWCGFRRSRPRPTSRAPRWAREVPLSDAVFNIGRIALLVAALAAGDTDALRSATQDRLHQDRRLATGRAVAAALQARSTPGPGARGCRDPDRPWRRCARSTTPTNLPRNMPADGHTKVLRIDHGGAVIEATTRPARSASPVRRCATANHLGNRLDRPLPATVAPQHRDAMGDSFERASQAQHLVDDVTRKERGEHRQVRRWHGQADLHLPVDGRADQ